MLLKASGLSCRPDLLTTRRGIRRFFFFQAEDGIRDLTVTGVQTCALPIFSAEVGGAERTRRRRACACGREPRLAAAASWSRGPRRRQREPGVRRPNRAGRSEEGRGGEEGRSRWAPDH